MQTQERFSVLLVDDDPAVIRVLSHILSGYVPLRFATSGRVALKLAREFTPDLVLLDIAMPELSGFEVCEAFKSDPALAEVPIILMTSHQSPQLDAKGLAVGAADFIRKPIHAPLVLARVRTYQRLKMLSDTLRDGVTMDFLTGAVTRRRLERTLAHEWLRAQRSGLSLALLVADIDEFAAYNAEFDEQKGNACLHAVAEALRSVAKRPADVLGRHAGGKFALLLPETDAQGARRIARSAIEAVHALRMPRSTSIRSDRVTLSVGGACCDCFGAATRAAFDAVPDDLIRAAELALKNVKASGDEGTQFSVADLLDPPTALRRETTPAHDATSLSAS
jgi:diguanylate cyclase (GGDEF)-like protein